MAELLKALFTDIRPNLIYDVTKYLVFGGIAMVVAAFAFLYRYTQGYPRDLVLIGTIFVAAFMLMVLAVVIAAYTRRKERSSVAKNTVSTGSQESERKLTFEIAEKDSQVHFIGGGPDHRLIEANVKLRCLKTAEDVVGVRDFRASLCYSLKGSSEKTIVTSQLFKRIYDFPNMQPATMDNGWIIREPISNYRWVGFHFEISTQLYGELSRDHFIRVTMEVVGQEPLSQDFYVDSWHDARTSISSITLKEFKPLALSANDTAHKECQRTIDNLESKAARLQQNNETQGIQIAARDAEIANLQKQYDETQWLRDIAKEQAQHLSSLVHVEQVALSNHNLFSASPYFELRFTLKNFTVYDVSIKDVSGYLCYGNEQLETSLTLVQEPLRNLNFWHTGVFFVRQQIKPHERTLILNGNNVSFSFQRVAFPIRTSQRGLNVAMLMVGSEMTNEPLLAAYPKLSVTIQDAVVDWALDSETFEIPKSQFFLNITLDVQNNGRPVDIEIAKFKLITEIMGKRQVAFAEPGKEVWSRMRFDKQHGLVVEGKRLVNLNASSPLVIPDGKAIKGRALQFMLDPMDFPEFEAVVESAIPFRLVLIDADGEEHPQEGAMRFRGHPDVQKL